MNVAHILLGSPWLYDSNVTSCDESNTYTFIYNDKKIVLISAKPKYIFDN